MGLVKGWRNEKIGKLSAGVERILQKIFCKNGFLGI
jgi:hypothetical protein